MNFQFAHPAWLLLLPPALAWVVWLAWKTDVQIGAWRRWTAMGLRLVVVTALILAMAGFQWLRSIEGMNVFFLLDRSDSIPPTQQERARRFVNEASAEKQSRDEAGVVIFGADAAIETLPNERVGVEKIQAVVSTERSDLAAAIRLGTAAFPETGQKRLVLVSDGNENLGEAQAAVLAARQLDVTLDVLPLGMARTNDVSLQRLSLPGVVKEGQPFEVKIFVDSDQDQTATLRLYRNDQFLGSRQVELAAGKNLFSFSDQLVDPNFYNYQVQIDAPGDTIPQNNRAAGFTTVRGDPRILVISADPDQDRDLVNSLQSGRIDVRVTGIPGRPANLAEMQSYDSIFLSNVAAGDLGEDWMELLESAVRDFGVGLVCVGGDQTYMAGGYRGTPLETTLPVNMELDSKKVLPSGALVMIMHGMEFANG
ncbi:MAG TPA: VWA domain-containing protein, partial [Methylomirabilota bacterium]|nr:VWA domain-containing protein [Methylomirabilota bacterium]